MAAISKNFSWGPIIDAWAKRYWKEMERKENMAKHPKPRKGGKKK